jgi:arsenite-transporting ATPase
VGKTTMAAATALHLTRHNPGTRILLFSTDPAHSLSDSLDQQVGDTITAIRGVDGLFGLEVDADRQLEDLRRDYRSAIDELLHTGAGESFDMVYDRQVMEQLITLTPPGLDELMGLITIMDLMEKGEFDRYVMDMAPTGHALRFLEMPGVVRSWFMTLFRLFVKYKGVTTLPEVVEMLRMKSKQFRKLQELLVDSNRCQFVTVAIPETMCVLETQRLLAELAKLSVTCRLAIVNMVVSPKGCASCSAARDEQQRSVKALQALTALTVRVPLLSQEVRGLPALSTVAGIVFGGNAG